MKLTIKYKYYDDETIKMETETRHDYHHRNIYSVAFFEFHRYLQENKDNISEIELWASPSISSIEWISIFIYIKSIGINSSEEGLTIKLAKNT